MEMYLITKPMMNRKGNCTEEVASEKVPVHEHQGMLLLDKDEELERKYPSFWWCLERARRRLRYPLSNPAQLTPFLMDILRENVRIETNDFALTAALLNLDEEDRIFAARGR